MYTIRQFFKLFEIQEIKVEELKKSPFSVTRRIGDGDFHTIKLILITI